MAKQYAFKGLEGCVVQSRARTTGTLVGLYHGQQSGIEMDPETPWVTVCEEHGSCVCHETLALAKSWLADPAGWCEDCREPKKPVVVEPTF